MPDSLILGSHSNQQQLWFSSLLLLFVVCIAAILRLHAIDKQSVWMDELSSLSFSAGWGATEDELPRDKLLSNLPSPTFLSTNRPPSRIAHVLANDTHPPAYFLLLHFWRAAFGESVAVARGLSALFSVGAVFFLFDALRISMGWRAAIWGSLLLAVSSSQILFAHEVRSHAMLTCLILACCAAAVRIERLGASFWRCLSLALLFFLAMATHYYAAYALLAVAIYLFCRLPVNQQKKPFLSFLSAGIGFVLFFAPLLWRQRAHFQANLAWSVSTAPDGWVTVLQRLALVPLHHLVEVKSPALPTSVGVALIYLLPGALLKRFPSLLLWWLMLLIPIGGVFVTDLFRQSWMLEFPRYTACAAPAIAVILAIAALAVRGMLGNVVAGVMVLGVALALPHTFDRPNPDYRAMANYVCARMTGDDALVILQNPAAPLSSTWLYLAVSQYANALPAQVAILTRPADGDMLAHLRRCRKVWILNGTGQPPAQLLPGATSVDAQLFARVTVVEQIIFP